MNIDDSFSSDFLKASDLQGAEVIVTIDRVVIEPVGRTKEVKPVAYFRRATKGLILNKTNANRIAALLGTRETTAWATQRICLYPTTTEYQGEHVACIRVKAAPGGTAPPAALPLVVVPPPTPSPFAVGVVADDDVVPF